MPLSKTIHGGCPVLDVLRGWRILAAHDLGKMRTNGFDRSPAKVVRISDLGMHLNRIFECRLIPVELQHHELFLPEFLLGKAQMRLHCEIVFADRVAAKRTLETRSGKVWPTRLQRLGMASKRRLL